MRLSRLFVTVLHLVAACPPVAAETAVPPALGVRFDTREILALGWRESLDPAAFPLRQEGKSESLVLGLVAPTGGARIFVIYSLPANPMPLASFDTEPPPALLTRLGVRRHEASGSLDERFLSDPPLGAIHWTLVGPGDGTTFSGETEPGQNTFSLRTILSLVVTGVGDTPRPLVLSAFLRCRPGAEAAELKPRFEALLKTLAPAGRTIQLTSAELVIAEAELQGLTRDLTAAATLLERLHPTFVAGQVPNLAPEDRQALEAVIHLLPNDPVAHFLLATPPPTELDAQTGRALTAYRKQALESAKVLEDKHRFREHYVSEPPAAAKPPGR